MVDLKPNERRIYLPDGRVLRVSVEMLQSLPTEVENEVRDNALVNIVRLAEKNDSLPHM